MPSARISERLLALFTTRERAAAIVGDLLELHLRPAAFWSAVLRTAWALSWRVGFGLLLAAVAEFYVFGQVANWAARPPHGVDQLASLSGFCCALFTAGALFSLVRFGPSAAIARLSAALALLTGLHLFFWWMPFVRPACAAMAALVVLLACLTRQGRLASLRLLGAMVAASAPVIAASYVVGRVVQERCQHGCNLDLQNTPILIVVPLAFLLSSAIVAGVLGRNKPARPQLA
jgi:hypothetical protein